MDHGPLIGFCFRGKVGEGGLGVSHRLKAWAPFKHGRDTLRFVLLKDYSGC